MKLLHRKVIQAIVLGVLVGPILRVNGMSEELAVLFALVSVAISLAYSALEAVCAGATVEPSARPNTGAGA
jgi:hypothetical protein